MFLPFCHHHIPSLLDPCALQLLATFAVERELQERRQRERIEKSIDNYHERETGKTAPLKRSW